MTRTQHAARTLRDRHKMSSRIVRRSRHMILEIQLQLSRMNEHDSSAGNAAPTDEVSGYGCNRVIPNERSEEGSRLVSGNTPNTTGDPSLRSG